MATKKVRVQRLNATFNPGVKLADDGEGDGKARRKQVTWYTGATVQRESWDEGPYLLTLDMKPESIRMGRIQSGKAAVLDAHKDWTVRDQIGVVESASIENGKGIADLKFSERKDVDDIWSDIQNGIIRNASVGTRIYSLREITEANDKMKHFLAVDWEPLEISICPIGADPDAGFSSGAEVRFTEAEIVSADIQRAITARIGEKTMPPEVTTNAGNDTRAEVLIVNEDKLKAEGASAERKRAGEIRSISRSLKLGEAFAEQHVEKETTVDAFRKLAIDEHAMLADRQPQQRSHNAEITRDEVDTRREAMTCALLNRRDPRKYPLVESAREYANLSLLEMAKECLQANNIRYRGLDRMTVAKLAFEGTSDFPNILANVLNKNLRSGYEIADALSHWKDITARRTSADFKQNSELQLDSSVRLDLVPESGEIKHGAMVEGNETWQILTYAQIIAITRQIIINDDLAAFTRIPLLLGQEVAVLEATLVWGIITSNPTLKTDTVALFNSAHKNIDSAQAIAIASLGSGIALMMQQTTLGGKVMNVAPKFLVVPVGKLTLARQYTSSAYVPYEQAVINPWNGSLTPIGEARLDVAAANTWYLFADPEIAPIVIYAYLEGQEGPYTETRQGFDVDGVEIKIRHDFGTGAIDYRGAVQNPGA